MGCRFRPLSRWIGSYTWDYDLQHTKNFKFPAPLEVDRFLYKMIINKKREQSETFPSPLEVDRFLYLYMKMKMDFNTTKLNGVSVPSRGR